MYSSVSSSITAQEMGVITHTLTIANDNLSPFENDECCTLDEKEKKIMQQCAVDLCGMPSEVESAHITDVDFETKIKDEKIELDYQKFVPDLKKLVKNKTDKALATIVKVKKNMADNPDYFDFDKVDKKTASEIIEDEIRYKIDLKTIREEDGSKSIEFETREEETDEHILLLLEEYKTYRRDKIKNNFSYGIYDDYYTLEEGKKYLLGMLTAAVERFEKLKIEKPQIYNSNPSVFDDGLANVLLQKELINSETEIYNLTNMFYPLLSGHMLVNNMLSDGYVDYAVPSKSFECKNQASKFSGF